MVGLAVTKQACKLAMAAGHRSGGIGETKTPGGSWAMFKAGRCSVAAMPTAAARVALRARLALARVLLDATTSAGAWWSRDWWVVASRRSREDSQRPGLTTPFALRLAGSGSGRVCCPRRWRPRGSGVGTVFCGGGNLGDLVLSRCSPVLTDGDLVGLVLARCSAVLGGGELGGLGSRRWIAGGDRDRCLLRLLRLLRDL